ncbi:phospholipid carrier-dependent glycosyltransferase [Pseudonocardia sp. DSM 110487]|uniref:ArnT family glycosyltransferase n=1 Tax=Pseudonocardia sp. DSM 110487 TaxID=2865833 RepID=UPI001C69F73A|nr:phospholipid carrier-dependent glycosyltransferase [Pseudonocardia sp. DSM 110487]QYN39873.1 phospholipid carrier-dependent glycosyltransferase [Pseudonocardia sp. DSM 110487]
MSVRVAIGGTTIDVALRPTTAPGLTARPPTRSRRAAPVVVAVLLAAAASALYLIRLRQAPDFTGDEALYAIAGRTVAEHGDIAWGNPIFVHPPGYFLLAGAWLSAFAPGGQDVLGDIHTLRHLNAILSCLAAALAGAFAAALASPRIRLVACCVTALLVAVNPISIRFGRMVMIEPLALSLALCAVLAAWRLRTSRAAVYLPAVGLVGGLALLTKSVTAFVIITPLVAALVGRRTDRIRREIGALGVAATVWLAFPIWAVSNGETLEFLSEQSISIRRLLGLLQLSGLNRPGVSALDALLGTLGQYAGAYLMLLAGGLGLLRTLLRTRPWPEQTSYLVSYCALAFGTLAYNVLFGQSNEQLFCYAFPAAALAAVTVWERFELRPGTWWRRAGRYLRIAATGLLVAAAVTSSVSWVQYQLLTVDDGTVATRDFLAAEVPHCVPVNGSGDQFRWGYVLRSHPVAAYPAGPDAVAGGVHVFILSTKDSQFLYGNSNPQLDAWVRGAGTELFAASTHTYGELSVWQVGAAEGTDGQQCAMPLPGAVASASAAPFLIPLGAAVALLSAAALVGARRQRHRESEETP